MRRKVSLLLKAVFLFLVVLFLFVSIRGLPATATFDLDSANTSFKNWLAKSKEALGVGKSEQNSSSNATHLDGPDRAAGNETRSQSNEDKSETVPDSHATLSGENDSPHLSLEIQRYVTPIMDPKDESVSRLECPAPTSSRYDYLRGDNVSLENAGQRDFFFALDLYQNAEILPRLIGSIVEAIRFLGPSNCALSIVEGRSTDGTYDILQALTTELEDTGALYLLQKNDINPHAEGGDRIGALANLRNQALQPLIEGSNDFSRNATVIFINDVAICMEDILELIHQRLFQQADMVCGMDWTYVGPNPTFYDVWIARDMNGESFFNIPEDGSWDYAWNLFWNNLDAKLRLNAGKSFQTFSCWNGATAFTAEPIIDGKIKFRSHHENECFQGEPKIFCKEMWNLGYGKIAVVPSVNLEYSDEAARDIKNAKGYVSRWVGSDTGDDSSYKIDWNPSPPDLVKCIPGDYAHQLWVDWNEALANNATNSADPSRLTKRSSMSQYWVPWDESLFKL